MADFSERLKELRLYNGISQQEIADYLGVNKQTISGYERGVRRPAGENSREIYDKIADYFNVDVSYLMGLSDVSIKIDREPTKSNGLPADVYAEYIALNRHSKEKVHDFIRKEYNYQRIIRLKKISNIEDARILVPDPAAYGGVASDEDIIAIANIVLSNIKKEKR